MTKSNEFVSPAIDLDRERMQRTVIVAQGDDGAFHHQTAPADDVAAQSWLGPVTDPDSYHHNAVAEDVLGAHYRVGPTGPVGLGWTESKPEVTKIPCDLCAKPLTLSKRDDGLAIFRCMHCDQITTVQPDGAAQCTILKYLFPSNMDPLSKLYQGYLDYYLERTTFMLELMKAAGFMDAQKAFWEWEKAQLHVKHLKAMVEQQRANASNRHKWLIAGLAGLVVWTVLILATLWVVGLFRL